MLKLGEYQTMTISRDEAQGLFLVNVNGDEVLLPGPDIRPEMKVGEVLQVFVYLDNKGRPMATTRKPLLALGEFATLRAREVSPIGAFMDWGISKDLLVPFQNQQRPIVAGRSYVVHLYLDEISGRLVGSTRLQSFLEEEADDYLEEGQEVDLLVFDRTELGYRVVVDQRYLGLVYYNEAYRELRVGEQLTGYIKPMREDGKIDVGLDPIGHASIEPNAQMILDRLVAAGGFLAYSDKSSPEEIRDAFGISKKLFKKAIGNLYRERRIDIRPEGIALVETA